MQSVPDWLYSLQSSSSVVDLRNVLPAAAVERFKERGKADIIDYTFPIDREFEIAKRFAGDVLDISCCGSRTVFGMATPIFAAREKLKNLSSADHQNGLLMMYVPSSANRFSVAR